MSDAILNQIVEQLNRIESKVDRIEKRLESTFEQVVRNSEDLSDVKHRITVVNRRLADVELDVLASKQ